MTVTSMSEALLKGISRGLADTQISPEKRLSLRSMRDTVTKVEKGPLVKEDQGITDVLDSLLS